MSGLFLLNALAVVAIGAFAVATTVLFAFLFMTQLKAPKKSWVAILRLMQGLALIGFVGAFLMQAFGLWIT